MTALKSKRARFGAAIIGLGIAAVSLTGCGDKYSEPFQDAPRNGTFDGPAKVITMPDGFSNAAVKCIGPAGHQNGVYTLYHGDNPYGNITVIKDDPVCNS